MAPEIQAAIEEIAQRILADRAAKHHKEQKLGW